MITIKNSRDIFLTILLKNKDKKQDKPPIGIAGEIVDAHLEWRDLVKSWWPMDIDSSFDIGEAGA